MPATLTGLEIAQRPAPRLFFYALFNLIDSGRGEKADLIPVTMDSRNREAFHRWVRQMVDLPGGDPFEVWCARPEDIIVGKLMAWAEGRSRKHETDIYEMLVFQYGGSDQAPGLVLDRSQVDVRVKGLGAETQALWSAIREAAQREVQRWADSDSRVE